MNYQGMREHGSQDIFYKNKKRKIYKKEYLKLLEPRLFIKNTPLIKKIVPKRQLNLNNKKSTYFRDLFFKEKQASEQQASNDGVYKTRTVLARYYQYLTPKYRLLTLRSIRLKKYKVLRKKWLSRKAQTKIKKIKDNRYRFFSMNLKKISPNNNPKNSLDVSIGIRIYLK